VNIVELERDRWQGHPLPMGFVATTGYDIAIQRNGDDFEVSFTKQSLPVAFVKQPVEDDRLFQDHWDDARAWGVIEGDDLLAVVETAVESWNNRLRITELWVGTRLRRQGVATTLMNAAFQRARDEGRRMVVLETQSNNTPAIEFYLRYGFELIGFDASHYSNDDVAKREVRLEFGKPV